MTPRAANPLPVVITLALAMGACDCENDIRKAVSNPGERKMTPEPSSPGPTEAEPNDTADKATQLRIKKELRTWRGSLADPSDVDYWALSADEQGRFSVRIVPDDVLDLAAYVEIQGSTPVEYNVARAGGAEKIPTAQIGSAPLVIAVRSAGGEHGAYRIVLERLMSAGALEAEPNDDASVATQFAWPGQVQGFFDRDDDRDVYRVEAVPGKLYSLEVGPIADLRQSVRLFREAGLREPMASVQVTERAPARIPNLAVPNDGGALFLVLAPIGGFSTDRPYTVQIVEHPEMSGVIEAEPNDKIPQRLDGESASISGYIHSAEDVDRFLVGAPEVEPPPTPSAPTDAGLPAPAAARVDAGPSEGPAPEPYASKARPVRLLRATLTWPSERDIFGMAWVADDGESRQFRRAAPGEEVTMCGVDVGAQGGVLEVRAESRGGGSVAGTADYALRFEFEVDSQTWEAEPNDERAAADLLDGQRRGHFGAPGDIDYWAFSVSPEQALSPTTVSVSSLRARAGLRVLDDAGGEIGKAETAGPHGARVTAELPEGLYFAEVRLAEGEPCADGYSIER